MAARQFFFNAVEGRTTTTSTTDVNKLNLVHTPDGSSTYLYFATAQLDCEVATSDARAKLENNAGTAVAMNVAVEPQDLTDTWTEFGFCQEAYGASPGSQTYRIDFSNETGGTIDTGIAAARILALKKDAADQFAESTGATARTSSTYLTKVTQSFTPATAGDYLLFFCAEFLAGVTGDISIRGDEGGTKYGEAQITRNDATTWSTWATMVRKNLTAASRTQLIEFASEDNATSIQIRNARVLAIRLDTLDNNYYAESLTRTTTTSATPQDKTTLTQTPLAVAHAIFGGMIGDVNSTSSSGIYDFEKGGVSYNTDDVEGNEAADEQSFFTFTVETLAASSTVWKTQFSHEAGGVTTGSDESTIAVIQLESPGNAVGNASGVGTATATGQAIKAATAATSGVGAATGVGQAIFAAAAAAAGTGVATGVGIALKSAVADSPGIGVATGVGQSVAASIGLAAGSGVALGIVPVCPEGVTFDGTNDWLTRGGALSGISDGSQGAASFWIRFSGSTGTAYRWFTSNTTNVRFRSPTTGEVIFRVSAGGGSFLNVTSTIQIVPDTFWHHVLLSWDTNFTAGNKLYHLVIDDVVDTPSVTDANPAFNVDYTTPTDWIVGAGDVSGLDKLNGDQADFWFTTEYLDFSVEAERRKFITASGGAVADLGASGGLPTGTAAKVYLRGPATNFATNLGSGGNFTVTGTLTDSADDPPCGDVSVIEDGDGSASGSGVATAVGQAIFNATASTVGTGTATAVGHSTTASTASSSGSGVAAAVGSSIVAATGIANGSGVGAAVGQAIFNGIANAAAVGIATAVGVSIVAAVANAIGSGVATAVSQAIASSTASAISTGVATAVGRAIFTAVATAAGTGAISAVGRSDAAAVATATGVGVGAAVGIDASGGSSTGASSGTGIAAGVGSSIAAAVATATGTGAANAVGVMVRQAAASAVGVGAGNAVGISTVAAVATAVSIGQALGFGGATIAAVATAIGIGIAEAIGIAVGASKPFLKAKAVMRAVFSGKSFFTPGLKGQTNVKEGLEGKKGSPNIEP